MFHQNYYYYESIVDILTMVKIQPESFSIIQINSH